MGEKEQKNSNTVFTANNQQNCKIVVGFNIDMSITPKFLSELKAILHAFPNNKIN